MGLWTFDNLADQIADDQRLTVEIQYGGIELVERTSDHARIRLVDGAVTLRQVRIAESGYEEVLRQQQRPLTEVLGEDYSVLPVLRVNDRWFLTEINPLPVPETPS
ncbi:MAG: hypothetical protein HC837_01255 [Chloroflexaceae bacterium]|nr:hypothetical protein [Chloroflexaceae bacterium]